MPLETGFWACATTTVRGRVQTASREVPSLDLIRESPVKGVVAADEFCTGKLLPSRLDWCMRLLLPLALLIGATSPPASANPTPSGSRTTLIRGPTTTTWC